MFAHTHSMPIQIFNPLHPNISMYILHTALHTFRYVLAGRIYLTVKSCFGFVIISPILITFMFDSELI